MSFKTKYDKFIRNSNYHYYSTAEDRKLRAEAIDTLMDEDIELLIADLQDSVYDMVNARKGIAFSDLAHRSGFNHIAAEIYMRLRNFEDDVNGKDTEE